MTELSILTRYINASRLFMTDTCPTNNIFGIFAFKIKLIKSLFHNVYTFHDIRYTIRNWIYGFIQSGREIRLYDSTATCQKARCYYRQSNMLWMIKWLITFIVLWGI